MNEKIKCLIIEDEWLSQQILEKRINDLFPNIEIVKMIPDIKGGVEFLLENKVDLVLFDVNIQGGTSFEILDRISVIDFHMIYLTAFSDYAVEALNRGAIYYLLKPFTEEDFKKAIEQFLAKYQHDKRESKIILSENGLLKQVGINNVLYLESSGSYTYIHTKDKRYVTSKNLGTYENLLPESIFLRCHNSYLVNCTQITEVQKKNDTYIMLNDEIKIPLAKRRVKQFSDKFKEMTTSI